MSEMTEKRPVKEKPLPKEIPSVANLGIMMFYDALVTQGSRCVQVEWVPPVKQSAEIEELLDEFL
ncbi:MAG: hypothetical protein IKR08_05130 [Firmicutes bacterium]|nr:hypothetical protein [Bacillota bacterium]